MLAHCRGRWMSRFRQRNWILQSRQGICSREGSWTLQTALLHPKRKNCLLSAKWDTTFFSCFITKVKFHVPGTPKITTAVRSLCIVFFLAEYEHSMSMNVPSFQPLSRKSHLWNTELFSVKLNRNTWIVIKEARISIRMVSLHVHKPRPHAERWIYLLVAVFTERHFHCSSWQSPDDDLEACNELTEEEWKDGQGHSPHRSAISLDMYSK